MTNFARTAYSPWLLFVSWRPSIHTESICRVFRMSSSGLASSTRRSAAPARRDGADAIELRDRGGTARGRHEHLHWRHARVNHHLHLYMLEVALPASGVAPYAAVGSHPDLDARVRQQLEVASGLLERCFDRLRLLVLADPLLVLRLAQHRHLVVVHRHAALEERLLEVCRRLLVREHRQVTRQRPARSPRSGPSSLR